MNNLSQIKKYTDKEVAAILDSAGFPKGLSSSQMINGAFGVFDNKTYTVTHWQPLPAPPKK